MKAQTPPSACASAMMWLTSVVFPEDSGPKISTIRPRGTPPMPSARSSASAPVGIASTCTVPSAPRRISAPWPKSRSIWVTAASSAASFALASLAEASFKVTFLSAISFTSLPPVFGQLDLRQRGVLRTLRLEFRTVERHSDAIEGLQQTPAAAPREARDEPPGASSPAPRGAPWPRSRAARTGASPARRAAPRPASPRSSACSAIAAGGLGRKREQARPASRAGAGTGSRSSIEGAGASLSATIAASRSTSLSGR